MRMMPSGIGGGRVATYFRAALALAAAGLVVAAVALPMPQIEITDPLFAGARTGGFTRDDKVMAVVIVAVAAVLVLAAVLRKPVVLSWALLPVGLFTACLVLT